MQRNGIDSGQSELRFGGHWRCVASLVPKSVSSLYPRYAEGGSGRRTIDGQRTPSQARARLIETMTLSPAIDAIDLI
jgi:hypothetical protein